MLAARKTNLITARARARKLTHSWQTNLVPRLSLTEGLEDETPWKQGTILYIRILLAKATSPQYKTHNENHSETLHCSFAILNTWYLDLYCRSLINTNTAQQYRIFYISRWRDYHFLKCDLGKCNLLSSPAKIPCQDHSSREWTLKFGLYPEHCISLK